MRQTPEQPHSENENLNQLGTKIRSFFEYGWGGFGGFENLAHIPQNEYKNFFQKETIWLLYSLDWDITGKHLTEKSSLSDFSPEFQARVQGMIQTLDEQNFFGEKIIFSEMDSSGYLHVRYENGVEKNIDLKTLWENALISSAEQNIKQQSREQQEALARDISKQAFYNNSVIAEYTQADTIAHASGIALWWVGVAGILKTSNAIAIESMIINDPIIGRHRIYFKQPYIGTIEILKQHMPRLLEDIGYGIDANGKVHTPALTGIHNTAEKIRAMSYDDFQKSPYADSKITETEFANYKNQFLQELENIEQGAKLGHISANQIDSAFTRSIKNLTFIGLSVGLCFIDYHREQNAFRGFWSLAEEWTFLIGYKLSEAGMAGFKIGAKIPGVWKPVIAIGAGIGGVIWVNTGLDKYFSMTRQKWKHFQESNYSDGRGVAGQLLNFGIPEALAGWNGIVQNVFWTEKDIDIGIDRTEISIFGKHLFTIPELTLYQQKVNLGISPHEWLQLVITPPRTIHDWNAKVDIYHRELSRDIYSLLGKYQRNTGVFKEAKTPEQKEEILQKNLYEIIVAWGNPTHFMPTISLLIQRISSSIKEIPATATPPFTQIDNHIFDTIMKMKVDDLYLRDQRVEANNSINRQIFELEQLGIFTTEQLEFLKKLPGRMQRNEKLTQTPREEILYQEMLNDSRKITHGKDQIEAGVIFAISLDEFARNKEILYFISQVKNGNMSGFEYNAGLH